MANKTSADQNSSIQNSSGQKEKHYFDTSDPSSRVKDTYDGLNVAGDAYSRKNGAGLDETMGVPPFIIGAVLVMVLGFYLLLFK